MPADGMHTLVARLRGGSGNQLFQYTAALQFARRLDARLVWVRRSTFGIAVDHLIGETLPGATPREIERVGLPPRFNPGFVSDGRSWRARARSRVRLELAQRNRRTVAVVQPAEDAYSDTLLAVPARARFIRLDGYFQHPVHWADTATEVAERLVSNLSAQRDWELGRGATVVGFRRGDYIPEGWELPLSYYERALERLSPTGPVWCVADDPLVALFAADWLARRGVAAEPPPDLGVDPVIRDVRLLIAADQVIMANSTLSWWGTFAGETIDRGTRRRVVMTPDPWLPLAGSGCLHRPAWHRVPSR